MNWLIFVGIALVILVRELYIARIISKKRQQYMKLHEITDIAVPSIPKSVTKRMIDIVISMLLCLSVLPIMYFVLGILIKLTSKGPVIFKQKRVGIFATDFTCYKFRTMYLDCGDKIVYSLEDKRVTPLGRFLRKYHLDEFPQFFNVLKGDMSVVGPRPLPKKEFEKFENKKEAYTRLILHPGITGLAQMNSGRFLQTKDYLQYDVTYVSKLSLLKDAILMWQTLKFNDNTC